LNHAILGGRHLYQGDDNFVVFIAKAKKSATWRTR
jgi:hypothetical protein